MKTITWKVIINENNQIATMEQATGIPQDKLESHLLIIGLLENLKQKHQEKLKTLYEKTNKSSKCKLFADENENDGI